MLLTRQSSSALHVWAKIARRGARRVRAFDVQSQSKQHLFQFSSNPFPQHPPTSSTTSLIHPSTGRRTRAAATPSPCRIDCTRRIDLVLKHAQLLPGASIVSRASVSSSPPSLLHLCCHCSHHNHHAPIVFRLAPKGEFPRVSERRLPDSDVFVVPAQTDSTKPKQPLLHFSNKTLTKS